MGIVSSIFWIMAGLFYILYRSYKEEPGFTLAGIFLVVSSVLAIVGFIELGDFLMRIDTTLGNIFVIGGAAAIVLAIFLWPIKHDRDLDRRIEENRSRMDRMFETEEFTEDYIRAIAEQFKMRTECMNRLRAALNREPTEGEIRHAALKEEKEHYRERHSKNADLH